MNMARFANDLQYVDQNKVESQGPQYPMIQYVNGKSALRAAGNIMYTGGFFLPAESVQASELPGFEAMTLEHTNNTSTEGWGARDLEIAFLRLRRCWEVRGESRAQYFVWKDYEGAQAYAQKNALSMPKGRTHVLVAVRRLEGLGPMVLTLSGTAARNFVGSRQSPGVMGDFNANIIRPASKIAAAQGGRGVFPYRAFWLRIGPERDVKGNPVFTLVGKKNAQSPVTPLVYRGPLSPDENELDQLYVGRELMDIFDGYWEEAEEWAHKWDSFGKAEAEPEAKDDADGNEFLDDDEEIPF
jgi:hypothetical protein